MKRIYNHRPDKPDSRDHLFNRSAHFADVPLPAEYDPRAAMPPILDQGNLGSCGLNSSGNLVFATMRKNGLAAAFLFSRLAVYYDVRKAMKTLKEDSGVENRDVMKILSKGGYAPETLWTYDISKFTKKPPKIYYAEAKKHFALEYLSLDTTNLTEIKTCLAQGFTFFFGFDVYSSFESETVAKTGIMPAPNEKKEKLLGGHDVHAVGYSDAKQAIICQNSWGESWGNGGYFYFPYKYFTDPSHVDSAWTIRKCD